MSLAQAETMRRDWSTSYKRIVMRGRELRRETVSSLAISIYLETHNMSDELLRN